MDTWTGHVQVWSQCLPSFWQENNGVRSEEFCVCSKNKIDNYSEKTGTQHMGIEVVVLGTTVNVTAILKSKFVM